MKKYLLFAGIIMILLGSIAVSAQVALARTHPLRPGHAMFPVQDFAEQARAQTILGDAKQAEYLLDLATRRSDDLLVLAGSEDVHLAAEYLDQAVDRLISSVNGLTGEDASVLLDGLINLVLKMGMVINDLEDNPAVQLAEVGLLQRSILTLEMLLSDIPGEGTSRVQLSTWAGDPGCRKSRR